MCHRLPLILSATALLVSVLGATPLGEAAYDAVVPKNSVGAAQLRNGAVTNAKLRGDAVTSGKVKNHSLKAIDFANGQLPAGPTGPKGDQGDKGPKGDTGAKGTPGATDVVVRQGNVITAPPNGTTYANSYAKCEPGERATGGGGGYPVNHSSTGAVTISESKPDPVTPGSTPTGWQVALTVRNGRQGAAYVICAKP